jgi:hypothetical protein
MLPENLLSKKFVAKLTALVVVTTGTVGLAAVSIVSPFTTPAAHAGWIDRLPVPTGAYLNINGAEYFYGDLNDRSQIFGGVSWQVNGANGILLKGYGRTPAYVINFVSKFLQPIRVQ